MSGRKPRICLTFTYTGLLTHQALQLSTAPVNAKGRFDIQGPYLSWSGSCLLTVRLTSSQVLSQFAALREGTL